MQAVDLIASRGLLSDVSRSEVSPESLFAGWSLRVFGVAPDDVDGSVAHRG
jgi:hypothetical protein